MHHAIGHFAAVFRLLGLFVVLGFPTKVLADPDAAQREVARLLEKASLQTEPNAVVLQLLLGADLRGLSEAQRRAATEQVVEGLRERSLVTALDSMEAMMGSMTDVVKSQFKPKNILRNTFGLGGGAQNEANQIMGEAIVGPWTRGLAAAGTLADAGYTKDATAFYQRCLAEPLLAPAGADESPGASFGAWVRARCEQALVDLGVAVAGPVFSDLAKGNSGNPVSETEETAAVAQAAGLSGFSALLEAGELTVEQSTAVAEAALEVLMQPKKKLNNSLASAAADVLGTSGIPEGRDALMKLAKEAKSGRFKLGRGSELQEAGRTAQRALARGFDHQASLDLLKKELLGGKGNNLWDAFETLFALEEPVALDWARQQLQLVESKDKKSWAEPLIERLGADGGPLGLDTLHDTEPVTTLPDDYVQTKRVIALFENGERERLPILAAAVERETWNLGGSALQQGGRFLRPLATVVARRALGLPMPQGSSDQMLVDFAFGATSRYDRQQKAEDVAVRKMRMRIATALSTWDDPAAVPLINRLLAVGDEPVRIAAARALLGQTSPTVVPELIAAIDLDYGVDEDEPRAPEIQAALLLHLGRHFRADPSALATLTNFERFEYDSVRFVAAALTAESPNQETT